LKHFHAFSFFLNKNTLNKFIDRTLYCIIRGIRKNSQKFVKYILLNGGTGKKKYFRKGMR